MRPTSSDTASLGTPSRIQWNGDWRAELRNGFLMALGAALLLSAVEACVVLCRHGWMLRTPWDKAVYVFSSQGMAALVAPVLALPPYLILLAVVRFSGAQLNRKKLIRFSTLCLGLGLAGYCLFVPRSLPLDTFSPWELPILVAWLLPPLCVAAFTRLLLPRAIAAYLGPQQDLYEDLPMDERPELDVTVTDLARIVLRSLALALFPPAIAAAWWARRYRDGRWWMWPASLGASCVALGALVYLLYIFSAQNSALGGLDTAWAMLAHVVAACLVCALPFVTFKQPSALEQIGKALMVLWAAWCVSFTAFHFGPQNAPAREAGLAWTQVQKRHWSLIKRALDFDGDGFVTWFGGSDPDNYDATLRPWRDYRAEEFPAALRERAKEQLQEARALYFVPELAEPEPPDMIVLCTVASRQPFAATAAGGDCPQTRFVLERSVVFEQAWSPAESVFGSLSSVFSGRYTQQGCPLMQDLAQGGYGVFVAPGLEFQRAVCPQYAVPESMREVTVAGKRGQSVALWLHVNAGDERSVWREIEAQLGPWLAALREEQLFDNALILLAGLGAGGVGQDMAWSDVPRTVLSVKYPGAQAAKAIAWPVSLLDVAPTILFLTGTGSGRVMEGLPLYVPVLNERPPQRQLFFVNSLPQRVGVKTAVGFFAWDLTADVFAWRQPGEPFNRFHAGESESELARATLLQWLEAHALMQRPE